MGKQQGFEFVEGATADLAFVAHGPSQGAAFVAAGRAFLAATVEDPECVERCEQRTLALREPDLELLLVRYLNELVYLRDAEELLLHPQRVEIVSDSAGVALRAELSGERIDRARHALVSDVKAATVHGLRVAETEEGWSVEATLDV
jgi:SHS2 domain-containing protein